MMEFMECDACRAPGLRMLCTGCLHNRAVISALLSRTAGESQESSETRRDAALDWAVREVIAFRIMNPDPYHMQPPPDVLPIIEASIGRLIGFKT
jgi:hypothetical protein